MSLKTHTLEDLLSLIKQACLFESVSQVSQLVLPYCSLVFLYMLEIKICPHLA